MAFCGYNTTANYTISEMLKGKVHVVSGDTTLASGLTAYFHIKTGDADVFVLGATVNCTGAELLVQGYSDSTVSADGTPMNMICTNRQIACSPSVKVYSAPTVTNDGSLVSHRVIYASSSGSKESLADMTSNMIFLLKKNSSNLFKLTNRDTTTARFSYELLIMEDED